MALEDVPTWRQLLEDALSAHAHLPYSRYVQFATVRPDSRPANRTVVFRFFLSRNRLLFTADTRSDKIAQLAANPWAEVCWYFVESRQQFRLSGKAQVVTETDDEELLAARERTWRERSEESRQSFTWPAPGLPRSEDEAFSYSAPAQPPSNFGLLILTPERVEYLDLRPHPHERRAYCLRNGEWGVEALNP
ncbi:MAG TPA: pyridoxamine 5'-phosphate oxidase family protein [Blastocatellia bacterium]|nr:pyridoxamine 5'-phosphate oxidase family protein [Blastocatellia bacterium]